MTKEEIIERYGKGDGDDEHRYEHATVLSSYVDKPVFMCFEGLVNLENKGLIKLEKEEA